MQYKLKKGPYFFEDDDGRSITVIEDEVYVNKSQAVQKLKDNIRTEIRAMEPETLRPVMENVLERARLCHVDNEHHLQDIKYVFMHSKTLFPIFTFFYY